MNRASQAILAAALGLGGLLTGGCVKSAGVVFPPPQQQRVWPAPPEQPRIGHVGQLATSADLKPGVGLTQAIGQALFGKSETYSMLSPFAACTDGRDRVFVADSTAQFIHVFDLKSRKYARWKPAAPLQFSQPVGVAWDPRGRLFVSDSVGGCVFTFDAQGKPLGQFGTADLKRPAGIAWDAKANRLLVVDTTGHCVVAFSPEGAIQGRFGKRGAAAGEFNFPTNITVDHAGRIYVSDTLNFRVQQLASDFKPLRMIGQKGDMPGSFSAPKGVAVDSENHLYVVDAHFEAVQIFDAEGRLLMSFGEEGHGPGQFWLPAGIFIDANDRLWVADSYNRRVQVFDYKPERPR